MSAAVLVLAVVFGLAVLAGVAAVIEREILERVRVEREEQLARVRYLSVWDAFAGLPARLRALAASSEELAQSCRRAAQRGRAPVTATVEVDHWTELPVELAPSGMRGGSRERWQALDRTLTRLAAIHHESDASQHADAHEAVSIATAALAEDLELRELSGGRERCSFCARELDQVARLFAGAYASICDVCVVLCHEQITGA